MAARSRNLARLYPFRTKGSRPERGRSPLLQLLGAANPPLEAQTVGAWRIEPLQKGTTQNILYQVSGLQEEWVAKLYPRNWRRQAFREFSALHRLSQAGLTFAPRPVYLDLWNYPREITIQSWLPGSSSYSLPADESEWGQILAVYLALAAIQPRHPWDFQLSALPGVRGRASSLKLLQEQREKIPDEHTPKQLESWLSCLARITPPGRKAAPIVFCRSDGNIFNFLRHPGAWNCVDWEHSGWGDAAADIASLLMHPTLVKASPDQQDWLIETYCSQARLPEVRDWAYYYMKVMGLYWLMRYACLLSNPDLSADKRVYEEESFSDYLKFCELTF